LFSCTVTYFFRGKRKECSLPDWKESGIEAVFMCLRLDLAMPIFSAESGKNIHSENYIGNHNSFFPDWRESGVEVDLFSVSKPP
jgi:hypothetical protein